MGSFKNWKRHRLHTLKSRKLKLYSLDIVEDLRPFVTFSLVVSCLLLGVRTRNLCVLGWKFETFETMGQICQAMHEKYYEMS